MKLTAQTRRRRLRNRSLDSTNVSPLQSTFMQALHKAACLGAAQLIAKKAVAHGVHLSASDLKSLARHLEGQTKKLKLDPAVDDGRGHITIDVSDIDIDGLSARILATIPDLLHSEPEKIAAGLLPTLKKNWSGQVRWQRRTQAAFQRRLAQRLRVPFKLLGMCVTIATEFGGTVNGQVRQPDAYKDQPHRTDVLIRLHARACQVADEIRALLSCGSADGAMARWRLITTDRSCSIAMATSFVLVIGAIAASKAAY